MTNRQTFDGLFIKRNQTHSVVPLTKTLHVTLLISMFFTTPHNPSRMGYQWEFHVAVTYSKAIHFNPTRQKIVAR